MKKEVILILISIFLFSLVLPSVLAVKGLCVEAEISDISPSSINIGDEFTIGIHLENCGDSIPKNVTFEILSLPTHISVKEPMITYIPTIQYSNSERFIVFHMKIDEGAESGTYVIKTRLSYGSENLKIMKDSEISINVIGDEAKLSIASVKTDPALPYKGDIIELTLRIENFGDGTSNAIRVYAEHPFKGIKESFIGTLDSNEDGPAVFTLIADKSGDFEIPVRISYKDDFGDDEIQTKININILKKKINWFLIIFLIVLILLTIWGIRNYTKLRRTKNEIIHQLLSGEIKEGTEEKTSEIKIETDGEKKERKNKRMKEFKRDILKKYKK